MVEDVSKHGNTAKHGMSHQLVAVRVRHRFVAPGGVLIVFAYTNYQSFTA